MMKRGIALAALVVAAAFSGCDCGTIGDNPLPNTDVGGGGPNGSGGDGGMLFNVGGGGNCVGLECQQVDCPGSETTSVSGVVYEPAGTLPLYNALVYVPNAPLEDIIDGATCEACSEVSGSPLVATITDTEGKFKLDDVPVGEDIPLVIQIGKWRRVITVDTVTECEDNALTDAEQTSLPSNQSEGHIPKIALATGGADSLECLLRKIGLEPEEFTLSSASGRVNLFHGNGGAPRYDGSMNGGADLEEAQAFWGDPDTVMGYDLVLLACEGDQHVAEKPMTAREAMQDYANSGGRIFMSHWHNVWLEQGPTTWPATAAWEFEDDPPMPYVGVVDQSFPKGEALADWLLHVGGSTVLGELPITEPQHTLDTVDEAAGVQPWITGQGPDTGSVKYFTFNAPLGAEDDELCGRVVFSDIHVSSGDDEGADFPSGCVTSGLTPQEKALVFMLFDLSACITPDDDPPQPPIN
jgi:hypothetical protein